MNDLTIEWVQKAEGDYETTLRESRVRRHPNYDAVCFHAQQTAEKYLKAVLQESGFSFPKCPPWICTISPAAFRLCPRPSQT